MYSVSETYYLCVEVMEMQETGFLHLQHILVWWEFALRKYCCQILSSWLGDTVDSGKGLSYRPARPYIDWRVVSSHPLHWKWWAGENPISMSGWFLFMYSQKWHCTASLFPKQNNKVLSPNFHIHVSVSDLYIPRIRSAYFCAANFLSVWRGTCQLSYVVATPKKSFSIFPSPAGMPHTQLSLRGNNLHMTSLFPPRQWHSSWGLEYWRAFFAV